MTIEVSAKELDKEPGDSDIAVEIEHIEELTDEEYDRELVRRVAKANDLAPEHVAGRKTVMLSLDDLSVEPSDFTDE